MVQGKPMSELGSVPSPELEVSNFGPIVNANIQLKPLSVFVGPSNTGKTYLSILIYALHRFFSRARTRLDWNLLSLQLPETEERQLVSDESIDALLALVRSRVEANGDVHRKGSITFTPGLAKLLNGALGSDNGTAAGEILRSFGVASPSELIRKGKSSSACISVRRRMANGSGSYSHKLSLKPPHADKATIPSNVPLPFEVELEYSAKRSLSKLVDWLDQDLSNRDRRQKFFVDAALLLGCQLASGAFGALHMPAYYLPADRTGMMHTLRVVVSALIANASSANEYAGVRTPMLSGVVGDFLEQLIQIDRHPHSETLQELDFGSDIEQELLQGSVSVERSAVNGPPRFSFRPYGWKVDLPLTNSSGMVSELVPLVLYLRYLIRPGHLLILEEPESHLHPGKQVELMRQLAFLVRQGVRMIITTHSEWFLEELSNIVRRSALYKPSNRDVHGLEASLSPDQVGVWLFTNQKRPKGAVVKEIKVDESGLYPSGYDEVAIELHNVWADLTRQVENMHD